MSPGAMYSGFFFFPRALSFDKLFWKANHFGWLVISLGSYLVRIFRVNKIEKSHKTPDPNAKTKKHKTGELGDSKVYLSYKKFSNSN